MADLSVGRFQLVALATQSGGGGGVLWQAFDPEADQWAAVKIQAAPIEAGSSAGASIDQDFARKFAALSKTEGSGIAQIFAVGTAQIPAEAFGKLDAPEGRHAFMTTEWIEGPSLARRIEEGAMQPEEAATLMARICHIVGSAHSKGILHLNLKPSNIVMGEGGPMLVDFRTAWGPLADRRAGSRSMGAAGFRAPEQAPGLPVNIEPSTRSDVFSLGAILAALATGTNLPGDEELELVDPPLAVIFNRAMSQDPDARYASAVGLAAALDAYMAPEATASKVQTGASKTSKRAIQIAIAAGIMALLLFLLNSVSSDDEADPTQPQPAPKSSPTSAEYESTIAKHTAAAGNAAPHSTSPNSADRHEAEREEHAREIEFLTAQAGARLSNFSFHPADLDRFQSLGGHRILARNIANLVARHQPGTQAAEDTDLPAELAVFMRLDDLAQEATSSTQESRSSAPSRPSAKSRARLASTYPADRFARLESAMESLAGARPTETLAALAHFPSNDPQAALLKVAANFQSQAAAGKLPAHSTSLETEAARHPFLNTEVGILALESGNPAAALADFNRALAAYPTLASAKHHKAVALWRLGQTEQAAAALTELLGQPGPAVDVEGALPDALRSSAAYPHPTTGYVAADPWLSELCSTDRVGALLNNL